MKIRILYEEDIKNGVPHYTTVEIPDRDYMTVLEQEYQMPSKIFYLTYKSYRCNILGE